VSPEILYVKTLPTFKPLNPVKNVAKVFDVETSKRYDVAPVLAVQLAVKLEIVLFVVDGLPGTAGELNVNVGPTTPETFTVPVLPLPTTATICEPEFEVMDDIAPPPIVIFAAVRPVKFVPLIVIVDPGHPVNGEIEVIVGGGGVKESEKSSNPKYHGENDEVGREHLTPK
jgi:hypothetical protein